MKQEILVGDNRELLPTLSNNSIQTILTSPPFWFQRDYEVENQIGLELTIDDYIASLMQVFDECKRVLKSDGTFWLNIGDIFAQNRSGSTPPAQSKSKGNRRLMPKGYNPPRDCKKLGIPHKSLIGLPWRVALKLQEKGWAIRADIIWHKNTTPEKVKDRPAKSHEYLFLLAKSDNYYFDHSKIQNKTVWSIPANSSNRTRHSATFPLDLIKPCVLAGSKEGDYVLDPFSGTGTVGVACKQTNRNYIGMEINPEFALLSEKRIENEI